MSTAQANELIQPYHGQDLIPAEGVVADERNDVDSVFSANRSSTTSVASSILEYRRIHGRTYHSDKFATNYFIPNDDQQLESVELKYCTHRSPIFGDIAIRTTQANLITSHHSLTILFDDQLFLAPLDKDKVHRVLDVGTGSGIWAIEFADQFPNASVIGTDLSPCQPQWVPPNVGFEIDDATLEWTWDADYFDFVHIRLLVGGIEDWRGLLKEAYRCCAPGGWVESVEMDVEYRSDDGTTDLEPVLASVGELFRESGKVLKRPFFLQEIQRQAFDDAGFVDKKVVRYKIPVGPWPKDPKLAEVGRFLSAALENDAQGYTQMLWESLRKPADEYHVWLANVRKAIRNPKVHSYMIVHAMYGRKPEQSG